MELTPNQRLIEAMRENNITQVAMAEALESAQQFISALCRGKKNITKGFAARVEDVYDISAEWLLTGEGEMMQQHAIATIEPESVGVGVPYYDEDFLLGFDALTPPFSESPTAIVNVPGFEQATLWCRASGHSMEPEISNGDIIALQLIEDPSYLPYGDIYGFVTSNGMRTIKRIRRSNTPNCLRLVPTNTTDYDEQDLPLSQIIRVFRVMGAVKSF